MRVVLTFLIVAVLGHSLAYSALATPTQLIANGEFEISGAPSLDGWTVSGFGPSLGSPEVGAAALTSDHVTNLMIFPISGIAMAKFDDAGFDLDLLEQISPGLANGTLGTVNTALSQTLDLSNVFDDTAVLSFDYSLFAFDPFQVSSEPFELMFSSPNMSPQSTIITINSVDDPALPDKITATGWINYTMPLSNDLLVDDLTVSFRNVNEPPQGVETQAFSVYLDNVSLMAELQPRAPKGGPVPEPVTATLSLIGVGALLVSMRRRHA